MADFRRSIADNELALGRFVFRGAASLFIVQLFFQFFTLLFHGEYKGGLINARELLWQGLQSWPVVFAMTYSLMIYLALLCVVSALAALSANHLVKAFGLRLPARQLATFNLLLLYSSLLVLNAYHFPNSLTRLAIVNEWQADGVRLPYGIALIVGIVLLGLALLSLFLTVHERLAHRSPGKQGPRVLLAAGFLATIGFSLWAPSLALFRSGASPVDDRRPNVILIGLDSVRTDVIDSESLRNLYLPHLGQFLAEENTAWFANAYTPVARTFAAWYALLSGKEPRKSGVRYNLQALSVKQKQDSIVFSLGESGYYTSYGSDEKRFSAIDETFGFDETFGPPVGAAEWILSLLEDTPVHNIARGLFVARYLFPHTYGNRASLGVYKPGQFVSIVESTIEGYDGRQPLFLSIHLCLSHWPYTWSGQSSARAGSAVNNYFDSLVALDNQFGDIMGVLEGRSILANSVIVVFTDHGEGLVLRESDENDPGLSEFLAYSPTGSDRVAGHGSDLLTVTQNQIMVSIQDRAGVTGIAKGRSGRLTSLLDIAPTLLRIANLEPMQTDGIDLAQVSPADRVLYMETGFNPAVFDDSDIDVEELVRGAAVAYEVTKEGMLQIDPKFHDQIVSDKQRGATDGRYIVVSTGQGSDALPPSQLLQVLDLSNPQRPVAKELLEDDPHLAHLRSRFLTYYEGEL